MNEALAKDVERNVRRREEAGSAAGDLAVPQELKDMPIPPDSDPRKRRAMKAVTAVASSGSSQMESSRAVADESRMACRGRRERRIQKFDRTEHQAKNLDGNIDGGVTGGGRRRTREMDSDIGREQR